MKERLLVYLRGSRIGSIEFDYAANSREFSYDAEYLTSSGACPISLSLPLREKPFNSWETQLFFENLLPPVIVRRRLEKIIHHDADNYFAFLKTLGGDCAGAIALYPEDGGPSAARCFRFLREHSLGLADQMRFVDFFLYNFLIGNADAHAKNFSLLHIDGGSAVAPLYDAMSTLAYPNMYNAMAMEIGGHYEFKDVSRDSFAAFAEKCDINPRAVLDRLDALAERLPRAAAELAEEMSDEGYPSPIYARIGEVIREQIAQVKGS